MATPATLSYAYRPFHVSPARRLAALGLGSLALLLRLLWPRSSRCERKVVILEPYGMGDVLSLQPLVDTLFKAGFEVTFCGRAPWRPLIPPTQADWVDARLPWAGYTVHAKYGGIVALLKAVLQQVRALRPVCRSAIGIDPRGDVRSVLVLRAAGCTRVVSLSHYLGSDLPLMAGIATRVSAPSHLRRWQTGVALAEVLGAGTEPPSRPTVQHLSVCLEPTADLRIGLVPLAPWPGKEWPAERWRQLAARLRERAYTPVALCGPGQDDRLAEVIGTAADRESCVSVEAWCKCLARLRAVVAVDTGPVHLADALGVPALDLIGSSVLPLWAPAGDTTVVVHHHDAALCAPCHQVGNCSTAVRCMELISVNEVMQSLVALLARNNGGVAP